MTPSLSFTRPGYASEVTKLAIGSPMLYKESQPLQVQAAYSCFLRVPFYHHALRILVIVADQWATQPPVVKVDLTGKTVIVLGANTGLGFEAAKHFATMNPGRLILACRSESRGQTALENLKASTGYLKAELWIIDLASFDSVKRFADKFERDGGRLDILVENAAIGRAKPELTKDGWDVSVQVNHIATSLVALLLLPAMIKTAQQHSTIPRIVFVSTGAHYWTDIEKGVRENPDMLKTLGGLEYWETMGKCVINSSVLNVFFFRALNARLPPSTPLIVNADNPGWILSASVPKARLGVLRSNTVLH
ncbi:hypothetical protein DFH06DRAFT_1087663 [Mycena polygramma]|nr:hypothetical protein DFH06DRAFT_1087663 [Mycena polygramma]